MNQELNEAQKKAVEHFKGPMLVLAGPGSGKTRVITQRIAHLIQERQVSPGKILVITFTKAAAYEMKSRYENLESHPPRGVHFGTFHAIFFMILRYAYHYTADNIIRDDVKRDLLKKLVSRKELEIQDEKEFINDLECEIGRVKAERMELSNYFCPLCSNEIFQELFCEYQEALKKQNLLDFDDMLVYCYELLTERPDILRIWQQQFSYILIDEFQDISKIQYDIIRLLAEPNQNLFIVGDDDQSIYGFRGAKPDIMKQFLKDYKNAKQCVLDINYRCRAEIVAAASKVIGHNQNRLAKKLASAKAPVNHPVVEIRKFPRITEENEAIREKILAYRKQGIPYSEMAVLFRTNIQARSLSSKLLEFNIPFVMKERLPNLYEHWIVQDVLTYVRVANGNRERQLVMRIINKPKRYIHRNALMDAYVDWEDLLSFYEDKDWMLDRIDQLQYNLKMLAQMKPYAAVNFIRHGIGYDEYIEEYAQYRGIRKEDLFEILDELQEEAKAQESFEEWFAYMERYAQELKEQSKKSYELQRGNQTEDAVVLLTMHGAKGLEYECVFIPDANEGVTPHSKSALNEDMEEERRLFYVAMTRAKNHLHISYLKERYNKDVDISRFVEEIQEKSS